MSNEPPVFPGDLVLFHVSGNRFFIICAEAEISGTQCVGGLMTRHGSTEVASIELRWSGHSTFWHIYRTV